jgi:hypothetical protein
LPFLCLIYWSDLNLKQIFKMKLFCTIVLILTINLCNSQELIIKLDQEPELFTVDKIGNIYVYQQYLLKKHSSQGKLLAQYSNYENGKLYSIDASDPFRILLFYRDFNRIAYLDNKLNPVGNPINLNELGFNSVSAVCKSKQMAIWLYDEYQNKLIQYSFNPKGIINNISLSKIVTDSFSISYMIEYGNELYIAGGNEFVWVFDQYSSKANKLKINALKGFQIGANSLIYNNGQNLFSYSLQDHESLPVNFSFESEFTDAKINKNKVFVLNKNRVYVLQIQDK